MDRMNIVGPKCLIELLAHSFTVAPHAVTACNQNPRLLIAGEVLRIPNLETRGQNTVIRDEAP
jgi:hypothetical protein